MISLDKAVEFVLNDLTPLELVQVAIGESHGRILGETLRSNSDIPKYNLAAIDGYALAAQETTGTASGKPSTFHINGESKPGKPFAGKVKKRDTLKVNAGVRLPDGFDAVVKFEDAARTEAKKLNVYVRVSPWQNVLTAGREISAGDDLMPAGRELNAADMARLAEVGLNSVKVFKKPKVGLVSVGDEFLTEIEDDRNPGISRNQFLGSLIEESNAEFTYLGACSDSIDQLREKLSHGDECDNLIIMANQSIEHYNFLKDAFRELKMDLKFWRVAIKPGKSVLYGRIDGKPVLGISGNMWSIAVLFDQLVKPILALQSGAGDARKLMVLARLTRELRTNPSMTQIFKSIVRLEPNGLTVTPLIDSHFGELTALSMSNGFIVVPPHSGNLRAGDKVSVEILGPLAPSKTEKSDGRSD